MDEDIAEVLDRVETHQQEEIQELLDTIEEMEELTKMGEDACLHEELEENTLPGFGDSSHQLSCPCPKCTPRVQ